MDDELILSDQQLLSLFSVLPNAPAATEVIDDLRATSEVIQRDWLTNPGGEQRALAAAWVACAMGRTPRWHLTAYLFGYMGPTVEMIGWVRQDDLVRMLTQLVGLIQPDRPATVVGTEVGQAVADAIQLSFVETKRHDAWRPGMPSGSGWCQVVRVTAYGLARARPGASPPGPAPEPELPWKAGLPAELPPLAKAASPAEPSPSGPAETKAEPEEKIERAQPEPDPHDPTVALWGGKRIYLGNDTQVSRLFWLLAKPVGFPRQFFEVQQAIDCWDARPCSDAEIQKARLRVRKAASKLRDVLREAGLEQHVIIHRGGPGSHEDAEYSMIWRIPG